MSDRAADMVLYGDGSTGPLLPAAGERTIDVDRIVRQAVRFLNLAEPEPTDHQ